MLQAKIIIHSGYGSSRHLTVFKELGLQSDQIYIHGRKSRARKPSGDCQVRVGGGGRGFVYGLAINSSGVAFRWVWLVGGCG